VGSHPAGGNIRRASASRRASKASSGSISGLESTLASGMKISLQRKR
jgi:hypothetical protein